MEKSVQAGNEESKRKGKDRELKKPDESVQCQKNRKDWDWMKTNDQ